jgi:hypothetical protein
LHTSEDEYSIVNEGGIGFRSGDREAVPARTAITKPRGEMWSDHPSRTEFVARHATLGATGRRLADLDDQKRAMFLIDIPRSLETLTPVNFLDTGDVIVATASAPSTH